MRVYSSLLYLYYIDIDIDMTTSISRSSTHLRSNQLTWRMRQDRQDRRTGPPPPPGHASLPTTILFSSLLRCDASVTTNSNRSRLGSEPRHGRVKNKVKWKHGEGRGGGGDGVRSMWRSWGGLSLNLCRLLSCLLCFCLFCCLLSDSPSIFSGILYLLWHILLSGIISLTVC